MTSDLKSMSRKDLEKLLDDVKKALAGAAERDRREARRAAEKAASEYGFSLSEITDEGGSGSRRGRGGAARTKSTPQFANPADASQTWTGKGRQPNWYRAEIEKGTDPDSMRL
jgi:DNA-binding protein H-NS